MDPLDRYINERHGTPGKRGRDGKRDKLERISNWAFWGSMSMFPVMLLVRFAMLGWSLFVANRLGDDPSIESRSNSMESVIDILETSNVALLLFFRFL